MHNVQIELFSSSRSLFLFCGSWVEVLVEDCSSRDRKLQDGLWSLIIAGGDVKISFTQLLSAEIVKKMLMLQPVEHPEVC